MPLKVRQPASFAWREKEGPPRVVDDVRYGQLRAEQRDILQDGTACVGSHAHRGGVDQQAAFLQGSLQRGAVGLVAEYGAAAGGAVDRIHELQGALMEAAGGACKNIQILCAVQRRLGADGRGSAAGAEDGHGSALYGQPCIGYRAHEASSVGIVADEPAIFIDHRVDSSMMDAAGESSSASFRHPVLVGHGQVKAPDSAGLQALDSRFKLGLFYVKAEIYIIQAQLPEGLVVHKRRQAVSHRAAQKSRQARAACD
mgnify:CR=1 FL=1